jgi:glycerol transport system substrate-binding protein
MILKQNNIRRYFLSIVYAFVTSILFVQDNHADEAEKWADDFQPSVLSREEIIRELNWFHEISKPFRGKTIRSVAEDIKTHYWERDILTTSFREITGINVDHEIVGEGTVVQRLMKQLKTGRRIYDIYVNDADLIGTHLRGQGVVNLTEYMNNKGRIYTNPRLDLDDFLNLEFGQDYNGNQLQLPDQQFANLYWFRHDWFARADIKKKFMEKYGYGLGVPVNWAAYEDIAEFFTHTAIDGKKVFGHLDYGKKSPSLGWRFTDAWLSVAGVGDKGLPNGYPVDEWGIRVKGKVPVGSSVRRGGAVNGPAAVYALSKYLEWLNKYAPPEAKSWRWVDAGPKAARGDIAQNIFQYTTWLSDEEFHRKGSAVVDKNGDPLWRVAPTPHGRYWDKGMKVGYQDAGSWTIPKSVKGQRRTMAWLWAQFCVSKTVSLKKFIKGGTPVRRSTVFARHLDPIKGEWGGLIEFYRSPEENKWTDTGPNVPHYPALAAVWWPKISRAIDGEMSPREAMDAIAKSQDQIMERMKLVKYSPRLNPQQNESFWLSKPGAPKMMRNRPKPLTIEYEKLIETWSAKKKIKQDTVLKFGVTPWKSIKALNQAFAPLMAYIGKNTGFKVIFWVTGNYDDLGKQLKKGELDFGFFSPNAYVTAKESNPGLRYLLTILRKDRDGVLRDYYRGVIITKKSSPFRSLKALKNKRFAFTDHASTSGYVYPAYLLKKQNIDPLTWFSHVYMLKKHDRVTAALMDNLIEAGATWDGHLREAEKKYGLKFHVLQETPPIPLDAIAAGGHVKEDVVFEIKRILLKTRTDQKLQKMLKGGKYPYSAFSQRDDSFYDAVRKIRILLAD